MSKALKVPLTVSVANATAATRWVGGTATGAPSAGTWAVGDFVVAQNGVIWICTSAGTPGTWTNAGSSVTPASSVTAMNSFGLSSVVGTSLLYARQDHVHSTPATPATSVAGRTGAVTLTAADIAAGTFPAGTFQFTTDARAPVLLATGLTGTTSSRWVGASTALAPTSGSFNFGDWLIGQDGSLWACTVGGSPGTWRSSPLGRMASGQITANYTAVTAVTEVMVTGYAVTFTFVTGRRYRIWANFRAQNVGATQGNGLSYIRWASGTSVTLAGTTLSVVQQMYPAVANSVHMFTHMQEILCVASGATGPQINAGQNTLGVSIQMPSANSLVLALGSIPAQIVIEDIGV